MRQDEIEQSIRAIGVQISVPHVCVIPVRMTEAWLLFDEAAIRQAAGNRLGRAPLALPPLDEVEQEPDPKSLLYEACAQPLACKAVVCASSTLPKLPCAWLT